MRRGQELPLARYSCFQLAPTDPLQGTGKPIRCGASVKAYLRKGKKKNLFKGRKERKEILLGRRLSLIAPDKEESGWCVFYCTVHFARSSFTFSLKYLKERCFIV